MSGAAACRGGLDHLAADQDGCGNATGLWCPSRSTARTPKKTLSLERSSVVVVTAPTGITVVHLGSVVSLTSTSYPARSASVFASHSRVVLLVSMLVSIRTCRGVDGACA